LLVLCFVEKYILLCKSKTVNGRLFFLNIYFLNQGINKKDVHKKDYKKLGTLF